MGTQDQINSAALWFMPTNQIIRILQLSVNVSFEFISINIRFTVINYIYFDEQVCFVEHEPRRGVHPLTFAMQGYLGALPQLFSFKLRQYRS